jgi:hypothetical protein
MACLILAAISCDGRCRALRQAIDNTSVQALYQHRDIIFAGVGDLQRNPRSAGRRGRTFGFRL